MWVTGTWQVPVFDKVTSLSYGAMPLPKGVKQASNSGGWCFGMSPKAKDKDAAFKVMMAMCGKEGMKVFSTATQNLPARKSLYIDPDLSYLQKGIYPIATKQLAETAVARPRTSAYPDISQALQKCFNDVAYGKDPAVAMDEYSKLMNAALKKVNSK